MKAIVCKKTGSPKVLNLINVEKPIPNANEVLIKVYASTVTRGDVNLRKIPRFVLYIVGLVIGFKPMDITGVEFAGIIEETGNSVINLKNVSHLVVECCLSRACLPPLPRMLTLCSASS